jgi:D-arginine dehydrogenase
VSRRADVVIVGAGIAGASLAAEIAGEAKVLILEAESQPGYHATGRSAAFWSETYGGPLVQPLTSASGPFLAAPPARFSDRPFLGPRGALHIADAAGRDALDSVAAAFAGSSVPLEPLGREALAAAIPGLRAGWDLGLSEPSCADIDVAALHGAYLRCARVLGAELVADARVERALREGGRWRVDTRAGRFEAEILVNAAGAWADEVALAAGEPGVGIRPFRRTMIQLRVDPPVPADLPLVVDALGRFYFKPEAGGRLWLSPHDETPCAPGDCAAEEHDVALAIDRLERVVDWRVERVERRWAGLRSFAPDRGPVYGFGAGGRDGAFFWCAGQGGFGIQTAPAAAKLAAALLLGGDPDPMVAHLDPERYLAARFRS